MSGRKRRLSKGRDGTRTALYLRVSTADQKPDLQYDGLRTYAAQAGLDVVQDYCDVGVSVSITTKRCTEKPNRSTCCWVRPAPSLAP